MKKNRILIISIVLAIALVACPIESTRNITAGIGGRLLRSHSADRITENKPRKPVLGGMCFFMFAAFLLWFGIMSFAGMLSIS